MIDQVLEAVQGAVSSPWFYAALFAFACLDGFFPVVPSESLVITAGVYAASGEPNVVAAASCAAAGAVVGDHVAFWLGRSSRGRLARLRPDSRWGRAFAWASRTLERRGGLILVVARYVPGGRTAVTMTMGAVGYPARWFAVFAGLAGLSWGVYATAVGYVGGRAFEESPVKGLLVGFGLALGITVLVEAVRWWRARRRAGRGVGVEDSVAGVGEGARAGGVRVAAGAESGDGSGSSGGR
ncbi:DedA family protein [Thermomonospora umbrina]|uniref:Membrane protein DedA with SNARE-associated domain n=1 Tax=Thermomonospora umbrina TaxID=111806 RepID=A0A3D9SY48_9ACTN|nr:DedA family protein [Thermomonospora umbrina]REF00893.1 membrane protein DedA with SNARE-associated domain [Thermomonospora umbrina]